MADYIALYSDGCNKPVVTHSVDGHAMAYTEYGTLAQANTMTGFKGVVPTAKTWEISGSFGIGTARES